MSGEEEENAAELKIGDEFLKAKCLMNCEVSLILDHKLEQLQAMSDDPSNQVSHFVCLETFALKLLRKPLLWSHLSSQGDADMMMRQSRKC